MVTEAQLEESADGLVPSGDGWFVVNVARSRWLVNPAFGSACVFEGPGAEFPDIGLTLHVLAPGQANGMYHRELDNQEDFLVLAGECVLLIEEEERALKALDFVHCPSGTNHIFVGAGEGACVRDIVYPRSELALRHGAGVEQETPEPAVAYAAYPDWEPGSAPALPALGV